MATSFPYLAVAKFFQVDYGRVLAQAELLDRFPPKPQDWSLQDWQVATITAWRSEQERRKAAQPQMVQWSAPNDITSWAPDPSTGSAKVEDPNR